jgi:hypothetical protein
MDTKELLYLIELPNENYSYVYTDKEGNILPVDDEEIPYYVNDLDDFYYIDSSFGGGNSVETSFVGNEFMLNSSEVNNSFNNLLI